MESTSFEDKVIEAFDDCTGAVKHCGKHAVTHLTKAWAIREIDKEMAIFRGITAEEEAASCLFYSLKNNRYINADRLLFREHTYKLGVFPFLRAIGQFLSEFLLHETSPFEKFYLNPIVKSGRRALELELRFRGQDLVGRPQPPLHFSVTDPDTGEIRTFERNFAALIKGRNYHNALAYIKDIASLRNKILYASEAGRPSFTGNVEGFLQDQKRKVFVMLSIVLLSDPWHKVEGSSSFIQQGLDSYLLLLERIAKEDVFKPNQ